MKTRFIKSIVETSKTTKMDLPFQRSARKTLSQCRKAA